MGPLAAERWYSCQGSLGLHRLQLRDSSRTGVKVNETQVYLRLFFTSCRQMCRELKQRHLQTNCLRKVKCSRKIFISLTKSRCQESTEETTPVPILSEINPTHIVPLYFIIPFVIFSHKCPDFPIDLPFIFSSQIFYAFFIFIIIIIIIITTTTTITIAMTSLCPPPPTSSSSI